MAYSSTDTGSQNPDKGQESITFQAEGAERINLPSGAFVADAAMTREGDDLILTTPSGEVAVIEGYFSAEPAPLLVSPDGAALTPNLVEAFAKSPMEFAANETASDQSPVGAVEEVKGNCTVTRADGTVEQITIGTPIYQGDVIETDASGAVNIVFMDETSMAVSENARLAIDEYTFDPSTESGTTNFSVLRGLFVFTSGLIGRDDPDDVHIDTPVGSIGIRGTVIAGEINPGGESKITVLEGAIVVKNGLGDITLSEQFETVRVGGFDQPMENIGTVPANDIGTRFNSIGTVNPSLFTTINDAANEQGNTQQQQNQQQQQNTQSAPEAQNDHPIQANDIITLNDNAGLPPTQTISSGTGSMANTSSTAPIASTAVSSSGTGTGTNAIISTPNLNPSQPDTRPAGPTVSMMGGNIIDTAVAGNTVAMIYMSNPGSGGSTYTYTFGNGTTTSANGYYAISGNNVVLTALGASTLASSLDVVQLGGFSIRATDSSTGATFNQTFGVQVHDAHALSQIVNMNNPNATNGVSIIGDNIDNNIGHSITALGDVNHDGFDDFSFTNNAAGSGTNHIYNVSGDPAYLASGFLSGVTVIPMVTNTFSNSETVIAGIGDFNGDGINDYVIGQPNSTNGGTNAGVAMIISGDGADINSNSINITGTGIAGFQIGTDVDGIGDYNNDGYADVIIGAPGRNSGDGSAYFIKGGDSNWTADITNAASGGSTNWIRMDGAPTQGEAFGSSVAGLGDINGDGYSDFGIGVPNIGSGGSVYIYEGNQGANPTAPSRAINGSTGDFFGQEVSGLGDINGDGLSDILVGGAGNVAKIWFGTQGGYGTTADISLNIPDANYTLTGGGGVGDFNGDGYDDFVLTLADSTSTKAYVVFGKDFSGSTDIDISYLKDPNNAMEFRYNGANNSHDLEVSGIGDINGDGYDDFAIGLPDANGASAGNGGVAVMYGRNTGNTTSNAIATANGQALVTGTGNDVIDDGGFDGVSMRGGAGNDTFRLSNTNFLGIDGGGNTSGNVDRILMQGDLDFTDVNFEQISGIEAIQFGATNQTLTLTLENIFNLMKSSDTGYLKIVGTDAGSILNIDASTVTGTGENNTTGDINIVNALNEMGSNAAVEADSGGFRHFTIGGYDLYISDSANLSVNVV